MFYHKRVFLEDVACVLANVMSVESWDDWQPGVLATQHTLLGDGFNKLLL